MSTTMPDIANNGSASTEGALDWVGMSNIELPLLLASKGEADRQINASVEAFVNLYKPKTKGIHMSRLYLLLDELSQEGTLNYESLSHMLEKFVISHEGISNKATVSFKFDYFLRRKSLISEKQGWKSYPVVITASLINDVITTELSVEVPYSSTCPCSAALARQLIQEQFNQDFAEATLEKRDVFNWLGTAEGIVATPHSQRSVAQVKAKLSSTTAEFPITDIINQVEDILQTPVQAAVKREDEQEFARLNGQNLMFCEDAGRRIKYALNLNEQVSDFWIRVNHYESLHAHDAVSVATKGIPGGYSA